MDIMSVKEASERWNISERWIQKLCEEGRIEAVSYTHLTLPTNQTV